VVRFEGKTVLIVDDEFAVVESLTEILAWEGFAVLAAASGAEGLRMLESERPDWIVVDVMMPAMNGAELCRRIRALEWAAKLPIVLMSAAMAPPTGGDGACSWNVYLRKPFKVADLLQALEEAQRSVEADPAAR
jgi:CheY-like chemotaxis protein